VQRFITPSVVGQHDSEPDWSPDGSRLAFSRFVLGSGRGGAIHTIAADGSDLQLLSAPAPGLDIHHVTPAWSPKGKRIAFAVVDDDLAFGHIYTIRPNGHAPRQITFGAVTDFDPSWRPVSARRHPGDAPGRSDGASRAGSPMPPAEVGNE
jgi:Tol biopolymer transport system component